MADSRTAAQRNRAVRQEQFRDYLSKRGLLNKVIENVEEIEKARYCIDKDELQARKLVIDTNMRLINKYLGDEKHIEVDMNVTEGQESWLDRMEAAESEANVIPDNTLVQ